MLFGTDNTSSARTYVVGRKCFHISTSMEEKILGSCEMSCGKKREYSPADAYVVLVQHISNQWSHRSCFFCPCIKLGEMRLIEYFHSLCLSLLFSYAHTPSIPYVLRLQTPAHITLSHPSFSLLILCLSAVVR